MDSDGRRQTRITSLPGDERLPRWRHDSISLAFIWNHEGLTDLCLTAITSPIPECVTSQARVASYSWSPDGKIIAFDDLKTGSVYLYEVSTAAVSLFPFNANVKDPVFGVNSDRLYFAAKTGDDFNIWSAKLDGSSPRRLSWLGSDVKPQVSPRGDRLLYLTDFPGHCEPWLVDVDGKTNQYLLDRPHIIGYSFPPSPPLACGTIPRWSPNGSQTLIISGGSDSAGSLFLVTLDFSVTITPQSGGSEVQPERHYLNIFNRVSLEISVLDVQWSLDGNKVVLVSDDLGSAQIFLLRIGAGTRVGYGT
jgi:Tol biopolymer transport system component